MRREVIVNLVDDGAELSFKVRQMSAVQQERWINRAIKILLGGSAATHLTMQNIRDCLEKGNWDFIAGIMHNVDYEKEFEPLYNELLECCEHIPDKAKPNFTIKQNINTIDTVIGEVKNLYELRKRAFLLNFDFFNLGEQAQNPKTVAADIQIGKSTSM